MGNFGWLPGLDHCFFVKALSRLYFIFSLFLWVVCFSLLYRRVGVGENLPLFSLFSFALG